MRTNTKTSNESAYIGQNETTGSCWHLTFLPPSLQNQHRPSPPKPLLPMVLTIILLVFGHGAKGDEKVTLQLKWTHAFQFAGYYAAKEQGYYREAGLDVVIEEANPETDPIRQVLEGKAQYGVGTSSLILARATGKPVVVLAVIFQHSPYEIYTTTQINKLHDLVGKRLMIEPQSEELIAYLQKEGVPLDSIKMIPHSFNYDGLMLGKAEAISGYISNEPYFFRQAGYLYQTFNPQSAGIDFYGDNLFTSEKELREHPARAKAFREASLRGWQYAKEHKEEMIRIILEKYARNLTADYLRFESNQMIPLLQPDLIEIGYMNPYRWKHIANTYAQIGLMPKNINLEEFMYDATELNLAWFYRSFAFLILISAIAGGITIYIFRVNRRLAKTIEWKNETTKALQESEEKFAKVFHNSHEIIIISSIDEGRIVDVNDSIFNMAGYKREETIGFTTLALDFWVNSSDRNRYIDELKSQSRVTDMEAQFRKKSGEIFTGSISGETIQFNGSEYLLSIILNISERKKTEETLRLSEQKYRVLTESMKDVVWVLDVETMYFQYISPSVTALRGFTPDEIMALPVDDALTPEEAVSLKKMMHERATESINNPDRTSPKFYTNEVKQPRKDGTLVDTEVITSYYLNETTGHVEILGVTRDITERRQAESALKESEEKFREMAELLPQIVFESDPHGNLTYLNRQAYKISGYPEDQSLIGKSTLDFYIPEDQARAIENIKKTIEGKKESLNNEYTMIRHDGTHFNVLVYSNPILKNGQLMGLRGIIVDITEIKKTEQTLRERESMLNQLNATKDKFFSIIAHDLKSPFNSIIGFSELLKSEARDLDINSIIQYAGIIHSSANHSFDLLENLLNWARVQQGQAPYQPKAILINDLINKETESLQNNARLKNIRLSAPITQNIITLADVNMVGTVIRNLISNALKFTPKNGQVVVTVSENPTNIVVSVADNGIGMSQEVIEKLFRIETSTSTRGTENEKGTGLGLLLCKEFVSMHGGKIWVESEPQKGSTFHFTLPVLPG